MLSPAQVLFTDEGAQRLLPVVDHYAGSEKLLAKAMVLQGELGPIFDITADCEDGARAGAEAEHAEMAAALIASPANRFNRVGLRIHDVTHPHWRSDLEIVLPRAGRHLPYITLPKPRCAEDVRTQIATLREIEYAGGLDKPIPVHVLIETHGALREVWAIAALDGVESLDFGLMDFVSAHCGAIPAAAMTSPTQFEHPLIVRAKTEIAAAALAHGVVPTHNVTTELRDIEFISNDARRARREFGFQRMWSIHPNQILPIVEALRPDFSEIETATAILIAAQDNDWGPIQHAGRLHDRASYRYWWNLLARARVTGMPLPLEVDRRFFGMGDAAS